MILLQFQFIDVQEDEMQLVPEFCKYLKHMLLVKLNTKINRRKLSLRLQYIENEVDWINWIKNKKYNTSVQDIVDAITQAIVATEYKDNIWKIEVNQNVLIPNTYTSIDKLIRFINFGDNVCKGTGMFTNLEHEYRHQQLNAIWNFFVIKELGHNATTRIITA